MNKWVVKSHGIPRYFAIYFPKHPHTRSDGSVLEHRVVMEKKLGRTLKPIERVHHIDGDGLNNKPSNLELFDTPNQHSAHPHKQYQGWFEKGIVPWNKTFTTKICQICNKSYNLSPRASEKRKTCSMKCKSSYMSIHMSLTE